MRRILLLITDLEIGGTPTVVRELAIRLNAAGGAGEAGVVEVACLSSWGPVADHLGAAKVRACALDARGAHDLPRTVGRLVRLVRQRRYDTIVSFLVHANTVAALARAFLPSVRLIESVQTTQPTPRWHWHVQRLAACAADAVVVPSQAVQRAAVEWAGVNAAKIVVIPNAIDLADYPGPGDGAQEGLSVPPIGSPRVGFIGRLDPIKRVPLLVAAMTYLPNDWRLDIFGEGADRSTIERAIVQHGLNDRVTLHGLIARPQDALRVIDVLALPSLAEGFGLVLIEAMAAGVPVVAADVPGIRDVVQNGANGLLVNVTDAMAFADALRRAVGPARETMVAGGLRTVSERYDWAVVLPRYRQLLEI
jgi:glycosyltransferase involved in cell wall biosynthesis